MKNLLLAMLVPLFTISFFQAHSQDTDKEKKDTVYLIKRPIDANPLEKVVPEERMRGEFGTAGISMTSSTDTSAYILIRNNEIIEKGLMRFGVIRKNVSSNHPGSISSWMLRQNFLVAYPQRVLKKDSNKHKSAIPDDGYYFIKEKGKLLPVEDCWVIKKILEPAQ